MPPNTVLVTGATGLLGRAVVAEFGRNGWKVVGTGLSRVKEGDGSDEKESEGGRRTIRMIKLDLLDSNAVDKVLEEVRPDLVVHTAADRNLSSLRQDRIDQNACDGKHGNDEETGSPITNPTWHLNAVIPGRLAQQHIRCSKIYGSASDRSSQKPKTAFIYISTDYVFPGSEPPYKTDAETRPLNSYGESKRAGELTVLRAAAEEDAKKNPSTKLNDVHSTTLNGPGIRNKVLVLRVPILYGHTGPDESPAQKGAMGVLVDTVMEAAERMGAWVREMRKWRKGMESDTEGKGSNNNASSEPLKLQKMVIDDWARRYPTCVEDVARVLLDLAQVYLEHDDAEDSKGSSDKNEKESTSEAPATDTGLPRILHFTAEQPYTKYEMCRIFADILGLNVDEALVRDSMGDAGRSAPGNTTAIQRPYDTHLDVSETKQVLQLWRDRKDKVRREAEDGNAQNDGDDPMRCVNFNEWWKRELLTHR